MATQIIMVEMGGTRKRCKLVTQPKRGRDGGIWARAQYRGEEFSVTDVWGVWVKDTAWKYICSVLPKQKH